MRKREPYMVKFLGKGGWDGEAADACKMLEVGKEYEVEDAEIGGSHTTLRLKGIKGGFNSVMFTASMEHPFMAERNPYLTKRALIEELATAKAALTAEQQAHRVTHADAERLQAKIDQLENRASTGLHNEQPLFELSMREGKTWNLYADGRIEGFPISTLVINRALPLLNLLTAELDRARDEVQHLIERNREQAELLMIQGLLLGRLREVVYRRAVQVRRLKDEAYERDNPPKGKERRHAATISGIQWEVVGTYNAPSTGAVVDGLAIEPDSPEAFDIASLFLKGGTVDLIEVVRQPVLDELSDAVAESFLEDAAESKACAAEARADAQRDDALTHGSDQ